MNQRVTVPTLEYLALLSDDTGVIQHAVESLPNRSTGYCTDDVARGYIVALQRLAHAPRDPLATRLASCYLSFLHDAQLEDGRFHNFMSYDRKWLDDVGTHDSCGRAAWALGYGVRYAQVKPWQRVSTSLLNRAINCVQWLEFPRSEAYAMLGLSHAVAAEASPGYLSVLRHLAERLVARYDSAHDEGWEWFEPSMTYDNARLCEAAIRAGLALGERELVNIGLATLKFYERVVFEDDVFVPIGNDGWYERDGERARFGQQPLEAVAMVDAELAAYDATGHQSHVRAAEMAFDWYRGTNTGSIIMGHDGGCYDGLEANGPNRNMGAESTLAYLSAAYAMAGVQRARAGGEQSTLRIAR